MGTCTRRLCWTISRYHAIHTSWCSLKMARSVPNV